MLKLKYSCCLVTLGMGIVCASCIGSLDVLGEEAAVTESVKNKSEIEDDLLAPLVDDPGDNFAFVTNHIAGVGVRF